MKIPHIIGADISKKTIDLASHQLKTSLKIDNNTTGFKDLINWIIKQSIDVSELMIVMEHTGLYSYQLEQFLHQHKILFTKVPGLAIKRSMGLVRGKSDKQDAIRIAQYGFEKAASLVADKAGSSVLQRLQMLYSTRQRLVKNRASLIDAVKEYQNAYKLKATDMVIASQLRTIKFLDKEIENLNEQMEIIIKSDKEINHNYDLLQSITGVGKVVSLAIIIKTVNFSRFTNPRKFACYCGVAPFENTSGISIRGKTRVSQLADKKIKTLLDLASKSAIQHDKELHNYYENRTANGKSKMSTINVIRNKLLYRMFAVIKRQTPYEPLRKIA
ncbi:MAG TPA: IS110 family transposase [Puia sp.]|nr:IS110 family transposase [Puia sp.]